jgi:hypothetical protein
MTEIELGKAKKSIERSGFRFGFLEHKRGDFMVVVINHANAVIAQSTDLKKLRAKIIRRRKKQEVEELKKYGLKNGIGKVPSYYKEALQKELERRSLLIGRRCKVVAK